MLLDMVKKYSDEKYDLNCAEMIIYGSNEEYDLGLDKKALKLMAGFGGGMGVETTCGVITGAVAVLSSMFVKDRGHESSYIKELTGEFFEKFKEKLKSKECDELKAKYRTEEEKCKKIIFVGAEVLDEIIQRER